MDEFKAAAAYATERLRSLRGKLDLHNGTEAVGDKTNRASLIPAQILPLPTPPDPRPCGAGSNRRHPGGSFHGCERKIVF